MAVSDAMLYRISIWGIALAMLGLIATAFFLISKRDIVIIDISEPMVIFDDTVERGGEIVISFDYCKYVDAKVAARWELHYIDATIDLSAPPGVTPKQLRVGCDVLTVTKIVPTDAPLGRAYALVEFSYPDTNLTQAAVRSSMVEIVPNATE